MAGYCWKWKELPVHGWIFLEINRYGQKKARNGQKYLEKAQKCSKLVNDFLLKAGNGW